MCTYIYIYKYEYLCMGQDMAVDMSTHVYIYTHMLCMYVCKHTYVHIYLCKCMRCVYVSAHGLCMYMPFVSVYVICTAYM